MNRPAESEATRALKIEALEAFNRCLLLSRDRGREEQLAGDLSYARGLLALMEGRVEESKTHLDPCLARHPYDADAYAARAMARFFSGDLRGAGDDISWAIRLRPTFAEAYVYRSYVAEAQGFTDAVLKDLDRALSLNPNCAPAFHARGVTHRTIGESLEPANDGRDHFKKAIDDETSALTIRPGYNIARLNRGIALAALAASTMRRGGAPFEELRRAAEDYDAFLAANPAAYPANYVERGNIHVNAGRLLRNRGEDPTEALDKARADFDRAIAGAPDYPHAALQRANTEWIAARWAAKTGKDPVPFYERGLQVIADFLGRVPGQQDGMVYQGDILNELAEHEAAQGKDPSERWHASEEIFGRILAHSPRDPGALAGRAWSRYRLKNFAGAVEDFEAAIAARPALEVELKAALEDARSRR